MEARSRSEAIRVASPRRLPSTRFLTGLVALLALALPASASATHTNVWSDVSGQLAAAGADSDTKLSDIAIAPNGAAVAVGEQGPGEATTPVVFRRPSAAAGTWHKETLDLGAIGAVTDATLTDVAVTDQAAWAIGTFTTATSTDEPLVIRLSDSGDLSDNAQASWEALSPTVADEPPSLPDTDGLPSELGEPRSIALVPDSDIGLIGDEEAQVFTVSDDDVQGQPFTDSPYQLPEDNGPNGPVNGVTLYESEGFVVADSPGTNPGSSARIYRVVLTTETQPTLEQPTPAFANAPSRPATDSSGAELDAPDFAGVAASGANQATAVEAVKGKFWQPVAQGTTWQRGGSSINGGTVTGNDQTLTSTTPHDVARADYRNRDTTVIVGKDTGAHSGVVWLRTVLAGNEDFSPQASAASNRPLNGVAIASSEILVVGDGGVVKRYGPGPADPTTGTGEGTGTGTGGSSSGSGSSSGINVVTEETTPPPPPPDENDQPNDNTAAPNDSSCQRPELKGENVVDISVANRAKKGKRAGGELIVSFKLRKPAKVRAVALRDGKVVGQSKRRKMKAGPNQVKISYRKAPETVRIQSKLLKQCPEGGTDNS
jgi:hypothetical protein